MLQAPLVGVLRVHPHHRVGEGAIQLGHASRHGAGVPMLEHAAGAQPQVVVGIGRFSRRLVGQGEDGGLAIGLAVEAHAFAGLHVGVIPFAVAPQRLLAVDHRPAHAAHLVVLVELGQVLALAQAELAVFLEQALVQVEPEGLGLVVGVVGPGMGVDTRGLGLGELVDLAVGVQHLVQGLALVLRVLVQQVGRPHLVGLEALAELHVLPQVAPGLARGLDLLAPELAAALGIAEGPFLFHPHRAGQDQVGRHRRQRGVAVRHHDEVARITEARVTLLVEVGPGLHVVGGAGPVEVQHPVLEHAVLLHGVKTHLAAQRALGQRPVLLGRRAVLRVGDQHVGRQPVREGAGLARRAAGAGLAGQAERAVAGFTDLAHQQVDVVDHVVGPGAARVLVETHRPVRRDLGLGVGVRLSQGQQLVLGHTAQLRGVVQRVGADELLEVFEADRRGCHRVALGLAIGARVAVVAGHHFKRVVGAQAVADVGHALAEVDVLPDEVFVDCAGADDVVADVVQDRQVGLRLEQQLGIGHLAAAVREGRQHVHLDVLGGQPPVGDAAPQDGVHLGHVAAPQHEGVGMLGVVVAAHRLVGTEGADEAEHRAGHAVACVGVDVVAAQPGLHQLVGGVAFPDGPLARAEHAHARRTLGLERGLALGFHDVEGLRPADGRELAVLVELAVLHAQQRCRQAVGGVLDLGQEVALDAVQPLVHRRIGVALRGHDAAVLHAHQHAAAGAAIAAHALVPAHAVRGVALGLGLGQRGHDRDRDAGSGGRCRRRLVLDEFASGQCHLKPRIRVRVPVRTGGRPGPATSRRARWRSA